MNEGVVLFGVDGGNTKAICLLATADGEVIGSGRALGCADIHHTDPESAMAVIASAVEQAGAIPAGSTATGVFSLAGADWPEDLELLLGLVRARWPDSEVVNDGIGALRAAVPSGPGVVVVCGTGAATAARGADGGTWHSSFWQGPQGAHELGVQTLQRIVRADLGVEAPTALTQAVLAQLGEPDVESVLHRWTGRDRSRRVVPSTLAQTLLDTADAGDEAATGIVREHGRALGRYALAAARKVGIQDVPFTLALAGGVFAHRSRLLADALVAEVISGAPAMSVAWPDLQPAAGALLLAFDRAGISVSAEVEARLRATLPAKELFDTSGDPFTAL